jgi:hypothetical protein
MQAQLHYQGRKQSPHLHGQCLRVWTLFAFAFGVVVGITVGLEAGLQLSLFTEFQEQPLY